MSHFREILDVVELCEEQGFRVTRTSRGAGGYMIFPKDGISAPVALYNTRSTGGSQTRYLNVRSMLRRIGVVFPELEKPKLKEPDVATNENLTLRIGAKVGVASAPPAATPADSPLAAAHKRMQLAIETAELAFIELNEAQAACVAATKPLLAVADLIKTIRG